MRVEAALRSLDLKTRRDDRAADVDPCSIIELDERRQFLSHRGQRPDLFENPDGAPHDEIIALLCENGAIDLLLADLWVRLASLPPFVAAVIAKRLADLALQHAQGAKAAPLEARVVDDESLARFVDGIAMEIAGAC